jgi:hypothetical protein
MLLPPSFTQRRLASLPKVTTAAGSTATVGSAGYWPFIVKLHLVSGFTMQKQQIYMALTQQNYYKAACRIMVV